MQEALEILTYLRDDLTNGSIAFEHKLEVVKDFLRVDLESIIGEVAKGINRIKELENEVRSVSA